MEIERDGSGAQGAAEGRRSDGDRAETPSEPATAGENEGNDADLAGVGDSRGGAGESNGVDNSAQLEPVSSQDVEEVLDTLAPQIAKRINREITRITRVAQNWSGPLPPPADLARFERILPGCADRIVSMAEKAVDTSSVVETTLAKGDVEAVKRGQYLSSGVGALALVLAVVCAVIHQPWVAVALVGVPVLQFASRLVRSVREPGSSDDHAEQRGSDTKGSKEK